MTGDLYRDPAAPVAERVRDLLGRMTLIEKVGQVNQRMYGWHAYERDGDGHRLTDAFRAEVAAYGGMGALYGLQRADAWSGVGFADGITAADGARVAGSVQRHIVENTRLGIPVLFVEEVPHGHQALDGTVLPVNLAVGATWDPGLYEAAAAAVGAEVRARGGHVALVSALDLVRDPRWGRAEECFGEDPYLAARLTEALVRGMRTADVAVVLKHFAGQGATVGGRNSAATELGAREVHEIHLAAARAGIGAGAAGVMAAYNEFDGLPCVASRPLLTELLRERLEFDGVVMADGAAVDRLVRLTGDPVAAGALALNAGCDLSLWDACFPRLAEAVAQGLVTERTLDTAVARVLTLKFRLGLFEQPYAQSGEQRPEPHTPAVEQRPEPHTPAAEQHPDPRELSERIARASITLLAHDGGVLPLAPSTRRIAVLGPNADSIAQQIGDYTAPQRPGSHHVTILDGIRSAAPPDTEVSYAPGCDLVGGDLSGVPGAAALAAAADIAVLVLGGSSARSGDTSFDTNGAAIVTSADPAGMTSGEGVDLADLRLPDGQLALLDAVAATGVPVVVVLVQGRPHALPDLSGTAGAVLSAWYPGPWGGRAVADVLFGAAGPEGRLPVSIPRSAAQLPVFYNAKDHGYRGYVDQPATARYAFGHGLSYTTVAYAPPRLSRARVTPDDPTLICRVTVRNTGERPVRETVQLYLRRLSGGSSWPRVRELRGFARLDLRPGEETDAVFAIDADTLASVTRDLGLAVEPGDLMLETGPSSAETQGARLVID
ncbi:glycoside hydrolase family 3 N-terminal domain-containing protein [Streptomyces sp. NEAU-YJ-81]|uniref:glycoside hydrolase family 3 N-terminal domain-containing protein n=1 Tax=Streptomyces sp. NEAU-YJ-81 TaxID=2820288 RepID=UPI001ABC53F6|nr:glycoside hydrolase family 3 N-terminal domain-containing protein [Streptomyces sp. NEAU-YJ-81]MBO3679716.1 glycoside hydrolase family 3 C-terminal domain-containing protein [Streptomyces sp. NEAU-YJ-81]